MASPPVVIIGAGLSGLIAARDLLAAARVEPASIRVVERARGVGGRLATQRLGDAVLDHGAQFFTVRSDDLGADVEQWLAAGIVEEWCRGFSEVDGYPRYRVAGGMHALAEHLAAGLRSAGVEIITGAEVAAIVGSEAGLDVRLAGEGAGGTIERATAVIATAPIPLSVELLHAGGLALEPAAADAVDGFAYHRVIALLTLLDRSPGLPEPGALQQPGDDTFTFVADNQAKGISDLPAVTFHTAHERSARLWSSSDDEVLAALGPAAAAVVAPAEITEIEIVRWPHAGPVAAHPASCLVAVERPGGRVVLAGDGFGGSKVEGAYLSGRAAAAAISSG